MHLPGTGPRVALVLASSSQVVLARRLSVRQTEAWVKRYLPPRPRKTAQGCTGAPELDNPV